MKKKRKYVIPVLIGLFIGLHAGIFVGIKSSGAARETMIKDIYSDMEFYKDEALRLQKLYPSFAVGIEANRQNMELFKKEFLSQLGLPARLFNNENETELEDRP